MQKRGHRHKGAALADLALTQLPEWTHGFDAGRGSPVQPDSPSLFLSLSLPPSSPSNGLPNFPLLTVYVSSSEPEGPSLALVLTCVPSVHDYESFLLIRFIEPLHQTGATLCLPLFLSSPLFRVDSMYMYGIYTRCKNASREYATPNGFE